MMPGALNISTTLSGSAAVVQVAGEIDLASVGELVDAVANAVPPGGTVELDLTEVGFIDSAGVSGLNRCRRTALGLEAELVLVVTREGDVARLLGWTGLDRVLDLRFADGTA